MSFSDLFDSEFKQRNKGHFAAIVRVALVDGNISPEEKKFLDKLSRNLEISELEYEEILENSWTPNHYNAVRLKSINSFSHSIEIQSIPLEDLVEFKSDSKRAAWKPGTSFISVLHM